MWDLRFSNNWGCNSISPFIFLGSLWLVQFYRLLPINSYLCMRFSIRLHFFFCFWKNEHFLSGGNIHMVLEIYCTEHEFLWPFLCFSLAFGLYFSKKDSCLALMAPRRLLKQSACLINFFHLVGLLSSNTYSLIISTAASYFKPNSISAKATRTGARPRPATQWTATQASGFCWYL